MLLKTKHESPGYEKPSTKFSISHFSSARRTEEIPTHDYQRHDRWMSPVSRVRLNGSFTLRSRALRIKDLTSFSAYQILFHTSFVSFYYWVAYGQTQSRSAFCLFVFFFFFLLCCLWANPVEVCVLFVCFLFFLFFKFFFFPCR